MRETRLNSLISSKVRVCLNPARGRFNDARSGGSKVTFNLQLPPEKELGQGGLDFITYDDNDDDDDDDEEVIESAIVMDLDSDLEGITTLMVGRARTPSSSAPAPPIVHGSLTRRRRLLPTSLSSLRVLGDPSLPPPTPRQRMHVEIRNYSRFKRIFPNCFVASNAVDFLLNQVIS
jgi:hypothetical protein